MANSGFEILAPAGSLPTFVCAINNGADAVYIGGKSFSARKNAANFSNEEITEAVRYAHLYGRKVYVTVNTLVSDEEFRELYDFIGFLYRAGVDALIIQDLGIAHMVRQSFPDFPIHASTQMTIHNLKGALFAKEMGFSRVVLSRELTFDEIKNISHNADIELEVFVHGALCMCYSGQCLMSSFIGARSGNRGDCAQPCRLPYTLLDKNGKTISEKGKYLLSLKDLCLADEMDSLRDAGVKSLKIEGRMKSSEYVSLAVHTYNKYRDGGKVSREDYASLENIFSRNGFTKGYLFGKTGRDMLNYNSDNDKVYNNISSDVLKLAEKLMGTKPEPIPFDAHAHLEYGKPLMLTVTSGNNSVFVKGTLPSEKAISSPLTEERLNAQISKSGSTAFVAGKISSRVDEGVIIPIKEVNNLRRQALELLADKIRDEKDRNSIFDMPAVSKKKPLNAKAVFTAEIKTVQQAKAAAKAGFERIIVPYGLYSSNKETFDSLSGEVSVIFPGIMRDNLSFDGDILPESVYLTNISQFYLCEGKRIHVDFTVNAFNSHTLEFLRSTGADSVCISPEVNLNSFNKLSCDIPRELIVYGRIPVMTVQNCVVKSAHGHCGCGDSHYLLKDRKGMEFPLFANKGACTNTIYNCKPLYMADRLNEIDMTSVESLRFIFTVESPEEIKAVYRMYKDGAKADFDFTRGHYFRGV